MQPPSDSAPSRPRGLRYGSQGPVTISLGALPTAAPRQRRPEASAFAAPERARSSQDTVLTGSLLPSAPTAFGALPPRPAPPPEEPRPAPAPVASRVVDDRPPAPALETSPEQAPRASAAARKRPPMRRSAWIAAAAVPVLALAIGAVWLARPDQGEENAGAEVATAPSNQIPPPENLLPSETPDLVDPVVPTRVSRATPSRAARVPAVPAIVASAGPAPAAAPVAEPEAAAPVLEVTPVTPQVAVFQPAPAPIVPAAPRPAPDPDSPVSTAPPGLSPE